MDEILFDNNDEDRDLVSKTTFENFGIKYLYPWQRLVIANILEAYEYYKKTQNLCDEDKQSFYAENNDSFCKGRQIVLLPTGAGKSLCFQIPALLLDGPTMIIYPLLALMTDQQRRMEEGSLRSVTFRGGQTEEERKLNFEKIKNGAKIIIVNPEVLNSDDLIDKLSKVGIKHVAIDEAHCVTMWGDSFRPAYLQLGKILKKISPPVITAFTATASPEVLKRVSEILFDGEAHIVRSDSDRPNIHYYVKKASVKQKAALYLARKELHPMIIFCGTRNNAEGMARELNLCFGRETAKFYHAGLSKTEKNNTEEWFYKSKDGILCATCAYGMGVDKKDIKTVVHIEAPSSAEAYIQEAGRGGRDGSIAKAILLWSLSDSMKFGSFDKNAQEASMMKFAETTVCRRQVLLDSLGGEQAYCDGCDLCEARKQGKIQYEKTDWEIGFNLIKKFRNFYSEEVLEEEIINKMNEISIQNLKMQIWNHTDAVEITSQLKEAGKIVSGKGLWKGKLKISKAT